MEQQKWLDYLSIGFVIRFSEYLQIIFSHRVARYQQVPCVNSPVSWGIDGAGTTYSYKKVLKIKSGFLIIYWFQLGPVKFTA